MDLRAFSVSVLAAEASSVETSWWRRWWQLAGMALLALLALWCPCSTVELYMAALSSPLLYSLVYKCQTTDLQ